MINTNIYPCEAEAEAEDEVHLEGEGLDVGAELGHQLGLLLGGAELEEFLEEEVRGRRGGGEGKERRR